MKKKGLLIFLIGMVCTYMFATTPTYLTSPKNQASFSSNQTFRWISNEAIKTHELKIYNCDYEAGANSQSLHLEDYEFNIVRDIYKELVPLEVSGLACAIENKNPLVACNSGSVDLNGFGITMTISTFNQFVNFPSKAFGGITHLSNEHYVLAESEQNYIYYVPYTARNSDLIVYTKTPKYKLNLGAGNGIQGITYNPINNKIYVAQEKSPITLHEFSAFSAPDFEGNVSLSVPFNMANAANKWGIKSVNGLFHLSQDTDLNGLKTGEHLLVLSDESKVVIECDMNGNEISRLNFGNKIAEASGVAYYNGSVYITEKSDVSKGRKAKIYWYINKSHEKTKADLGGSVFSKKGISGESYSSVSNNLFSNNKTYCWEIVATDNNGKTIKSSTFSFNKGTVEPPVPTVPGCTDRNACNYNPNATQNDGSCEYTSCKSVIKSISSPYASQSFFPGNTINIKWEDNFPENVKIQLVSGSNAITVNNSTFSDGAYSYRIPNNITAASNYKIVIQKSGDANVKRESSLFTIKDALSINIYAPTTQESFDAGDNVYVRWQSNATGTFKVSLYKGSSLISVLTSSTSKKEYIYKLPSSLATGSNYRFLVKSNSSTSISNFSPYITFVIDDDPEITVTEPKQNAQISLDENVTIKWIDNIDEPVDIYLFKGGVFKKDIARNVSGNSYQYKFEDLDQDSDYNIFVRSTKNTNISDFGSFFTLLESEIEVWSPYPGNVYKNTTYISARWKDPSSTNVSIEIYENDKPVCIIEKSVPNNGSFDFKTPSLIPSSNYKVVIKSLNDPSKKGESGKFTIKPHEGISNIIMHNGSLGKNNEYVNQDELLITWHDNIAYGNVFMQIFKDQNWISGFEAGLTESDGIEKIFFPNKKFPTGDNYRIKIISRYYIRIYNFSKPFSIVENNGNRTIQFNNEDELGLLNIYPNPTKGLVNIDIPLLFKDSNEIQISVFNTLGQAILKKNYFDISSDKIDLNLTNEAKGLYFINLSNNHLNFKAKVLLD